MMRRAAAGLVLLAAACAGGTPDTAAAARREAPAQGDADLEARRLASEVRDIADRIADYTGSHRNRPPKRLADLGVDSLTPETARVIVTTDSTRIVVTFRRAQDRVLLSCAGGPALLLEAQLRSGAFALACRTPRGDTLITAQELP